MILIEKTEVMGFEQAIRGMRNPMNSWDKSDSYFLFDYNSRENTDSRWIQEEIGPNDHELMMKLVKGGPVHAKFRRMITVYVDITAPLYWWKEFDTYKVGTVANSCSTMHKIQEKEFTWEDFSAEHLTNYGMWDKKEGFTESDATYAYAKVFGLVITALNGARDRYLDYKDRGPEWNERAKTAWWQMIQLLPSSYNQKRTVMLNYEVLAGIYPMRRNHKLGEWHEFCHWIEGLPYSEIIIGLKSKEVLKTPNEIRAEHGFPPITDEYKDYLMKGDFTNG